MCDYYQKLDAPAFDYELTAVPGMGNDRFRGPLPDLDRPFIACIGAAQTFGRFVERPFPAMLQAELGIPVLNLGQAGTGPRFWSKPAVLELLGRARLVVVQCLAGRSASNSRFSNADTGRGKGQVIATGQWQRFEEFLDHLVATEKRSVVERTIQETRDDYATSMQELGSALSVPTVLLWFSRRVPDYRPDWSHPWGILNHYPQLIDAPTLARIKPHFDRYVESVSEAGIPQRLWQSRDEVAGARLGSDGWLYNEYYPSPEMNEHAAALLVPACRELLG